MTLAGGWVETGQELYGSIYAKGDVIFREGETGEEMYVIQSGAVQVSHRRGENETVIAILERGDFFGEMALFDKERRFATVTALCPTRLLPLTRASLVERTQRDPGVALHFIKSLILRIQEADHQVKKTVEGDEVLRWLASLSRGASRRAMKKTAGGEEGLHSALAKIEKDEPGAPLPDMALDRAEEAAPAGASLHEPADAWQVEGGANWFEPGESIFREGEAGDAMYIVLSGSVEITQGAGQDRWVLGRVSAGEFFGEWALVASSPRSSSATAISRARLMPIKREEFAGRISARPEIALYIIQGLCSRLRRVSTILANPRASMHAVRQIWQPLVRKHKPVKISIVSLATCAGCSAVLLDDEILAQVIEVADILYCPMLIDQDRIQEADVALIDGAVRLKEDQEKLEEARIKSRFVAAWGTCASFGGIPAEANRFEIEELVNETFGHTTDTFAYYLSGQRGIEPTTFQKELALLRKAYKLDDWVRVDYYVPGCPPSPALLLQLVGELDGREGEKIQPVVCGQCDRKPVKASPASLQAFARGTEEASTCFNSLGIVCLGFLTKGGCEAVCARNGLACWGCRGPAQIALKKMAEGDSFEEVVIQSLARRCRLEQESIRSHIKLLQQQGHGLFQLEPSFAHRLARIR